MTVAQYQQIIDAIDQLILAKLTGATDMVEFARRQVGEFVDDVPSSVDALTKLRETYCTAQRTQAIVEEGRGDTEVIMYEE